MAQQKGSREFTIPEKVLGEVINYLATCSYAQVHQMISSLKEAIEVDLARKKEATKLGKRARIQKTE